MSSAQITKAAALIAAADDLNRAIAITNTVWLALDAAEDKSDICRARDTLFEALAKMVAAETAIGVYRERGAANG